MVGRGENEDESKFDLAWELEIVFCSRWMISISSVAALVNNARQCLCVGPELEENPALSHIHLANDDEQEMNGLFSGSFV